jgi:UDP-glucose 4-epimerase
MDNRRLKRAGFTYQYTSAGAVEAFVEALRLRQTVGGTEPEYRYERDVEQFFRHSPAVVRDAEIG